MGWTVVPGLRLNGVRTFIQHIVRTHLALFEIYRLRLERKLCYQNASE